MFNPFNPEEGGWNWPAKDCLTLFIIKHVYCCLSNLNLDFLTFVIQKPHLLLCLSSLIMECLTSLIYKNTTTDCLTPFIQKVNVIKSVCAILSDVLGCFLDLSIKKILEIFIQKASILQFIVSYSSLFLLLHYYSCKGRFRQHSKYLVTFCWN